MNQSHYFSKDPITKSKPRQIQTRIGGIDFVFGTDNSVFSKGKLDFGSDLLIRSFMEDFKTKKTAGLDVLDLGCGYGAVGIATKRIFNGIILHMTDVNNRALNLAKNNCIANFIKFAHVFHSNALFEKEDQYDIILTNPPVRAGKEMVFRFYAAAFSHLKSGGILYVVIQNKQGAPSTEKKLNELFGYCDIIEKKAGYRVFKCIKQEEQK